MGSPLDRDQASPVYLADDMDRMIKELEVLQAASDPAPTASDQAPHEDVQSAQAPEPKAEATTRIPTEPSSEVPAEPTPGIPAVSARTEAMNEGKEISDQYVSHAGRVDFMDKLTNVFMHAPPKYIEGLEAYYTLSGEDLNG